MKITSLLAILTAGTVFISSCKKTDITDAGTTDEMNATTELARNEAIAESMVADDNDVLFEAARDRDLDGAKDPNGTSNFIFGCANVTVTPLVGFPKQITIDFGTGCTNNGITRKGKILITLTDTLRQPNSKAIMTFDNYYVNNFKRGGKITWTNTSVLPVRSWERRVDTGSITAPNGNQWQHNSIKSITQIQGAATPHIHLDDVFSISGAGTTTNAAGVSRSHTILIPVEKAFVCPWPRSGRVKITGPNHFVLLDYGAGTCDNNATISIDGGTPMPIQLH